MGTSDGALKIIDAHTLETRFLSTLEKEKGKQQSILDILHIKETHTVLVSFSRGEVWSFLDTIIHNELKLQCKIVLPGGSPCYHLVKVSGSEEKGMIVTTYVYAQLHNIGNFGSKNRSLGHH